MFDVEFIEFMSVNRINYFSKNGKMNVGYILVEKSYKLPPPFNSLTLSRIRYVIQ